ncbi:MAG: AIR synthase related protein [Phycisphaerae bacterium]
MAALTYESTGVGYDKLDAFKRACQQAAGTTNLPEGYTEPPGARGESAYLVETHDRYLAHVEEGLGTKNLVAQSVQEATGQRHWRAIGIDTVATIVNDLITCGAAPVSVAMHAAVADAGWFDDEPRARELAEGFAEGCRQSGCVWGGGETPALSGIVVPGAIVLAGSAMGEIRPKEARIPGDVKPGDAIVFLASTGVQTNGLTLCRKIAGQMPEGYQTPLPDGRTYGQHLLEPSAIYADFVAGCRQAGVRLKYLVHMTGHGWRKLMRLPDELTYEITAVQTPPEVFAFIEQHGPVEQREMYATFNMGVGFAAMVPEDQVAGVLRVATAAGHKAWRAGVVKQGEKCVAIKPLGITFGAKDLQLR